MQNWRKNRLKKLDSIYNFDVQNQIQLTPEEKKNLSQIKRFLRFEWFTEACVLKEGQTFGELALTNNAPRAASVLSITDCELAAISRDDYEKVIKRIEQKKT